jgi:hypothetical protein
VIEPVNITADLASPPANGTTNSTAQWRYVHGRPFPPRPQRQFRSTNNSLATVTITAGIPKQTAKNCHGSASCWSVRPTACQNATARYVDDFRYEKYTSYVSNPGVLFSLFDCTVIFSKPYLLSDYSCAVLGLLRSRTDGRVRLGRMQKEQVRQRDDRVGDQSCVSAPFCDDVLGSMTSAELIDVAQQCEKNLERRRRTRVQDLRHHRAGEWLSGDGKLLPELHGQVWKIGYLGSLLIRLESTCHIRSVTRL